MFTHFKSGALAGALGVSAMALSLSLATPAMAQVTTSSVQGFVMDGNGSPISNASATLTNTATGLVRTASTDATGTFNVRNLPLTGTYDVVVSAPGFQGKRVEGIALSLGDTAALNFVLQSGQEFQDEIIVVAQRSVLADVALGPSASFGIETLENAPAINRNIADIIRLDPRVYVDESRGDINSVQCVGQSSRFNSITLDGTPFNDSFGLNANGYPTERMPFPFAALDQVSVEIAPIDVKYGGFTACNINSVTKSGTNQLHGGAFIDYTDDGLKGSKAGDATVDFGNFDEIRYGIDIGGPIIKDKLFFYASYEKLDGANVFVADPLLNGSITQAQVDQIADIARNVYQYEPGTIPDSFANEDEKFLIKLDWNISNQHRAAFTYNYNDGFNIVRSDGDSNELEFSNHLYERGAKLESYVGSLYSDWTDNLSTELRVGYLQLDNRQQSVGGTDFGEMQIRVGPNTVYLGGDDSRQSNKLAYDVLDLSLTGNYSVGNHNFTVGAQHKGLDIFNLFVQHTETEIRFNSIADFQNQLAQRIYYNNSPSHNPNDAAADWGYAQNTLFAQDEWNVSDKLTVVAGLRYDWYTSNDLPPENTDFTADYGFSNAQNLDGADLLQPRFGFNYNWSDNVEIRGGIGRYSGGNPNVWLSNNYSSNNVTQFGQLARAGRGAFSNVNAIDLTTLTYVGGENGVPNGPGYAIPTVVYDPITNGQGSNFEINYLDPNFEIPSEWKYTLGATWTPDFNTGENLFGGEWFFQGDLMFSKAQNTAIVLRGDLDQTGTRVVDHDGAGPLAPVTYPTYSSPREDSFVLTNADVANEAFVASIGASKSWDNGISLTMGYAYSDAKDVQPMTSSVAFSNYNNRAYIDPQEQVLSTSNYNIKHRFTGSLSYTKDYWKDYDTSVFFFLQSASGRPYSRTLNTSPNGVYNFTPFLDNNSLLFPGTTRNEFTGPNWTKVDFKISQELPGLRENDRASMFLVIDNLTNLIDKDWGVLNAPSFPRTLTRDALTRVDQPLSLNADASTYEIRFGFNYDF